MFLLVVLTLGAFAQTINQDFTNYDDGLNFYQNPHLNPVPDLNLSHIFGHAYFEMYIPVSYTVFALVSLAARMRRPDTRITMSGGSLDPRVFHGIDLLLHLINVLLVFALLRRLLRATRIASSTDDRASDDWAAGVGALLFALHPVQVETVAWASQMRGLISGLFSLLALLAATGSRRTPIWIAAAVSLGVLAVLAKPSAVTLPLVALAVDHWLLKRPPRDRLSLAVPWLMAVSPFIFIAGHVQPTPSQIGGPLWARPFIAGDTLAFTLAKLVWPVSLGVDYGRTPGVVMSHWWGYATWMVPAIAAGLIILARKGCSWLVAGAVIGLVLEAPVLGLTPFIFQQYSTVADRYLYLVLLGPAIAAAFAFRTAMSQTAMPEPARTSLPPIIAALALGSCFVLTTKQMAVWDDSVTLMAHALRVNKDSAVAQLNLGSALVARGDANDAVPHLTEALALQPRNLRARTDLGLSYLGLNRPQDAIRVLREATAIAPDDADAHNALGLAYLVTAMPAQAVPEFQTAVRLQPGLAAAYDHLGRAYQQTSDFSNAVASYRHALRLDPLLLPVHDRLGDVLAAQGDLLGASDAYHAGLGQDPSDVQAALGLSGIEAKQGNSSEAVQVLRTALSYHPDDTRVQQQLRALMKK